MKNIIKPLTKQEKLLIKFNIKSKATTMAIKRKRLIEESKNKIEVEEPKIAVVKEEENVIDKVKKVFKKKPKKNKKD